MKRILPSKKIIKAGVVRGAGRGKKIKVPTINFDPASARGLREGIYVCRVIFPSTDSTDSLQASSGQAAKLFWGVLHYGPRPVFGEADNSLEVHLFEFDDEKGNFGQADIEIYDFIRKVANFKDKDALVARINKDISFARRKILSLET